MKVRRRSRRDSRTFILRRRKNPDASYRELLFTTPGLNEFISGVILFDETLRQKTRDGVLMPEVLAQQGIIPGIKVDKAP